MADKATTGAENPSAEEIEITPEMIDAGEKATFYELGGADLEGVFSAADLAVKVYRAMQRRQETIASECEQPRKRSQTK